MGEGTPLARPPHEREAPSGLARRDSVQLHNRDNEHILRETLRVLVTAAPLTYQDLTAER